MRRRWLTTTSRARSPARYDEAGDLREPFRYHTPPDLFTRHGGRRVLEDHVHPPLVVFVRVLDGPESHGSLPLLPVVVRIAIAVMEPGLVFAGNGLVRIVGGRD